MMASPHRNFLRITWAEALTVLTHALQQRYGLKGPLTLKKDFGYEGICDFYDAPDYVDIEIDAREENP
jgi:hypothetical protein